MYDDLAMELSSALKLTNEDYVVAETDYCGMPTVWITSKNPNSEEPKHNKTVVDLNINEHKCNVKYLLDNDVVSEREFDLTENIERDNESISRFREQSSWHIG